MFIRRAMLLCLLPAVATAGLVADVPLRVEAGIPLVEVRINGRGPFTFIVDTGATATIVTPRTATDLGVPSIRAPRGERRGELESLSVGDAVRRRFPVHIMEPLQAIPLRLDRGVNYHGILGYTFLAPFALTIDYGRSRLLLRPPESKGDAGASVRFSLRDGLVHVPVRLNQALTCTFLLDTGAAEVVLLPRTAARLGFRGKPLTSHRGVRITTIPLLSVGNASVENLAAVIHALPQDPTPRTYHGILGWPFLSRYRVTVDYACETVSFTQTRSAR